MIPRKSAPSVGKHPLRHGLLLPIPGEPYHRWLVSWQPYAVIVLIGVLVFGRTIWFGYTYFDDDILILRTNHPLSFFSGIRSAFSRPYFSIYYRPVVLMSFLLDAQISQTSPWMYHLSNLIFHLTSGCLLFLLIVKTNVPPFIAFPATLIFTIHPLTTQAVAWIPGRNDSILAIFILSATILLIRSIDTGDIIAFVGHLMLFLLALLTKESAIIYPVVCICYLSFISRLPILSKKTARFVAGWLAVLIVWYFMRSQAGVGFGAGGGKPPLLAIISNLRVLPEIFGKIVVPATLSVYPTFNTISLIIGVAVIAMSGVFLFFYRERGNNLDVFAVIWMLLFLLPGLSISVVGVENRFNYIECRAYLSVIGATILLAVVLDRMASWTIGQKWLLSSSLIVLFGFLSFTFSSNFADSLHHWQSAVTTSPNAADAHFNFALALLEQGKDTAQAERNYKEAIRLDPKNSYYRSNLGILYGARGLVDKAEEQFEIAIVLNPADPYTYNNLGYLHYRIRDFAVAESRLKEALELNPILVEPQLLLIEIYYYQHRYEEAFLFVKKLQNQRVPLDPEFIRKLSEASRTSNSTPSTKLSKKKP